MKNSPIKKSPGKRTAKTSTKPVKKTAKSKTPAKTDKQSTGKVDRRHFTKPYRWKKGQSGNPKGRPKGKRISEIFSDLSKLPAGEDEAKKYASYAKGLGRPLTQGDIMCIRMMEESKDGHVQNFQEIGDRLDPKPQRIVLAGSPGEPIGIEVRDAVSDKVEAILAALEERGKFED